MNNPIKFGIHEAKSKRKHWYIGEIEKVNDSFAGITHVNKVYRMPDDQCEEFANRFKSKMVPYDSLYKHVDSESAYSETDSQFDY